MVLFAGLLVVVLAVAMLTAVFGLIWWLGSSRSPGSPGFVAGTDAWSDSNQTSSGDSGGPLHQHSHDDRHHQGGCGHDGGSHHSHHDHQHHDSGSYDSSSSFDSGSSSDSGGCDGGGGSSSSD